MSLFGLNFLNPERLVLLGLVIALALVYATLQSRRKQYAVRFTNVDLLASIAPRRPGWRRHIPAAVFLLAIATLMVGLARPARQERVPRERATVIMAIDVSLSMDATDIAPSRIDAAKVAALSFIDVLPPKLNVGLVAFSGNAILKVPPTTDREQLRRGINDLELGERTAIGEAVFASLDAIKSVPPDEQGTTAPARVVLMSDGSTTSGRPNEDAGAVAKDLGIPVSTIAFGTDSGFIEDPVSGRRVPVPVNRDALKLLAEQTDGTYFSAVTEGQLKDVYQDIGSSVGFVNEEREVSTWFIGVALVMFLATSTMSMLWFSRLP